MYAKALILFILSSAGQRPPGAPLLPDSGLDLRVSYHPAESVKAVLTWTFVF